MCFSITPSLLPRPWFFQGLITGIALAVGYGFGLLVAAIYHKLFKFRVNDKNKRDLWVALITGWIIATVFLHWKAQEWQSEIRELVNMEPVESTYGLRVAALAILFGLALLGIARGTRRTTIRISGFADRFLPKKLSKPAGVLSMVLIYVLIFNIFFYQIFTNISDNLYSNKNSATTVEASIPKTDKKSGGPESLVSWESLGRQGRIFVGRGPSIKDIEKFSGEEAKQPIRVYVGKETKPTAKTRADLAVKELERTGAFDRKILVIANTTGSGWLEPQAVDSIEYMYGGDSAIVSTQYSYLPSWIAFLVEKEKAKDSGQALFNAVHDKWSKLPENDRPKLVTYGLSLGAFSAQTAFTSIDDVIKKTDGALFVGSPSDSEEWSKITKNRDSGSPQILPVFQEGKTIRFAANADDIQADQSNWQEPRVLYLQHATDSVVWFDFKLIYERPDWLKEEPGSDRIDDMGWYPVVTFFQVTVDQMLSVAPPAGHGHNYGNVMVASWAAIAKPEGWTDQKTDKLQRIIDEYAIE